MAYDSGRGLGKIGDGIAYEDTVDNPWDKGDASGLVHYTDAQREQASRGDFDEQTTDMWDVEVISSDDDDVEEETPEAQTRRKQLAAAKMAERMAHANVVAERAEADAVAAAAAAEREKALSWTKTPFLQRMMKAQGWKEGMGLGRNNQGRAEPVVPLNRGPD